MRRAVKGRLTQANIDSVLAQLIERNEMGEHNDEASGIKTNRTMLDRLTPSVKLRANQINASVASYHKSHVSFNER